MMEVWRGSVNAWECDELGHMNVRFYLAKASEAVAALAEAAGLNPIQRSDATATLVARDIHVRFLAEARPGAPLYIEGSFTGVSECSAEALLVMRHSGSGRPAASFSVTLDHVATRQGREFVWPARFVERAKTLTTERPDFAAPRGLKRDTRPVAASLETADALGLGTIGRGRFGNEEMDAFGRMRAEFLLGRISDSVTNFSAAFPEDWDGHAAGQGVKIASALLECRLRPIRWPRSGDLFVVRSGLKSVGPRVRNIVHWVLEPSTGKPWWTMEGVAAPMDLGTRKMAVTDDAMRTRLSAACFAGLEA